MWALGATLYAAVEGRPPYPDQGNAIALLATIASDAVPPMERASFLAEPISRMMDRDPTTRWSMDDAAHSLHRLHDRAGASVGPVPTIALTAPATGPEPAPVPAPTPTRERPRPTDGRRRSVPLPAVLAVLLLVVAGVAGFVLLQGNDDSPGSAEPGPVASRSPSTSGAQASQDTGSSESEAPPSQPPSSQEPPPDAGDAGAFAEQYYGYLPDDTESAYDLLAPKYQDRTSYADYEGFWRTISAVEVDGTTPVEGQSAIDVTLTYTDSDGGTEGETRRLFLEQTDDGYLVADDQVL